MKKDVIIFRIVTGLLTLLMGFSATMYFAVNEMVRETFLGLGFPVYIIYPLAIAKILGLIAIWSNKSAMLKEWAYAGFTFELLLASSAHFNAADGGFLAPLVALLMVLTSYRYSRKVYGTQ